MSICFEVNSQAINLRRKYLFKRLLFCRGNAHRSQVSDVGPIAENFLTALKAVVRSNIVGAAKDDIFASNISNNCLHLDTANNKLNRENIILKGCSFVDIVDSPILHQYIVNYF